MKDAKEIKKDVEKTVEAAVREEPETNKEARRRQPWMPLLGSIIAALILFVLFGMYAGWFG